MSATPPRPETAPAPAANPPPMSAYGELVLLSLIFGISTIAGKYAAAGFPVFTVATLRYVIAALAFLPLLLIFHQRRPSLSRSDLGWFVVVGATGYLGYGALFFLGLQLTTASHAVVMTGALPIVTAILSALILREALAADRIGGILLTMVGIALIVLSSGASIAGGSVLGDLAVLGAISSAAFSSIFAKRLIAKHGAVLTTFGSVLVGVALLTPLGLLTGLSGPTLQAAPASAWLGVLFSGTVATVIAYILMNRGIHTVGPTLTMVFLNLQQVWGFIAAAVLLGEAITPLHVVSAVLVVGGVLLANQRGLRAALRQRQLKAG